MSDEILIAGASARSAAQSAIRAGMQVAVADLFCDRDLPSQCQACRVEDYPQGILHFARQLAPRSWCYTGGLENHPELVDEISQRHKLLGNSGTTLRLIRDPWHLRETLERKQIAFPEILRHPPAGRSGEWIRKPQRSCGGRQISAHYPTPPSSVPPRPDDRSETEAMKTGHYYQRRIRGTPCGAIFVAAPGSAILLGVTRQLIGCRWAGATGFWYVGSIGPLELGNRLSAQLQRVGQYLAEEYSLLGLFGVDLIVDNQQLWVLEINPRFTASVEILERATQVVAMALHRAACRRLPLPRLRAAPQGPMHAKAIVYARQTRVVQAEFYRELEMRHPEQSSRYADLPKIGTTVFAGHPILTVFVQGDRLPAILRQLRTEALAVQSYLT